MDAHCSLLGRPASDTDCSNAVCAASPEQLAHCKGCARGAATGCVSNTLPPGTLGSQSDDVGDGG